jgi:hypothetical protein
MGCVCHRGHHFGLEPCLFNLPEPGNQFCFYPDADCCDLFCSLDRLGDKVNKREDQHVISWYSTFMAIERTRGVLIFVIVIIAVFFMLWMLRPYVSTEPLVSFW